MADDFTNVDLDLNLEPLDSSIGSALQLGSLLDELENTHGQIEERIRQLEAVTARARQRQRMRHTRGGDYSDLTQQETGTTRYRKRDRTCLVAQALELSNKSISNNSIGVGGGFFDCNLCLNTAKEPVLTSCGHLFCWVCFFHLPYVYSTVKECPSCRGDIMENNIVPIYGNEGNNNKLKSSDSHPNIPPRPKAKRVENIREQYRVSHSHTFSRVLSESAASLSSISSAINDAERLVEDLESYLRIRSLRRTTEDSAEASDGLVSSGTVGTSSEEQWASMASDGEAVSFSNFRRRLQVQRVTDSENETLPQLRRRRLI